jgi:hypothetical protein
MALTSGTKLGPYEIASPLGSGGMGEVYRARDTRLNRDVALKVLPEEFAEDPMRRRRFEEEARSLAALNHPNILVVFDVGTDGEIFFLVSELLEGETLRECMGERRLPVRSAVHYALEIAQGLAAAHEAGFVHRDLKPENVFITRGNHVKILDFGLAKQVATSRQFRSAPSSDSRTVTEFVMGTPGYSAPEQIGGKTVDHRADIFSLGTILYELLSGRRAFMGDDGIEIMNASVKQEPPDLLVIAPDVPPALEHITRRCLEKKPDQRFQCASDLAFAIEALSGTPSPAYTTKAQAPRRTNARTAAVIAAAVVACAGLLWGAIHVLKPASPTFRQLIFGRGYISSARFTPDGQSVVFGGAFFGRPRELFSTRLDGRAWRSLDLPPADILGIARNGEMGISLGRHNFYQWMVVGTLGEAPLSGGAPHPILEDVCDGDISPDGKQFAVVRCGGSEETLEYPIGKPLFRTNGWISHPRISPANDAVAFLEHPLLGDDRGYVSLVDTSGNSRRLTPEWVGEAGCAWSAFGGEIWFSSSYEAERQSLRAVTPSGKQRVILATVTDIALQDVSPDGNVLLTTVRGSTEMIVGHKGERSDRLLELTQEHARMAGLSYSGNMVALGSSGPGSGNDYSTLVLTQGESEPVRLGDGDPSSISPDGKWIFSLIPSQLSKFILYPTGTGQPKAVDVSPVHILGVASSWTSDGSRILFTGSDTNGPPRSYLLDVESGATRAVTPEDTSDGIISPDGKYVVARDSSRKFMVYSVGGQEAMPVNGLAANEVPIQWDASSSRLYVWNRTVPANVYLLDIRTGTLALWLEIKPAEVSGLVYGEVILTPDGQSYGYRYRRVLTDLFLAERLR